MIDAIELTTNEQNKVETVNGTYLIDQIKEDFGGPCSPEYKAGEYVFQPDCGLSEWPYSPGYQTIEAAIEAAHDDAQRVLDEA